MTLLEELQARGFIYQQSDEQGFRELLEQQKPQQAYVGFDCTADSLHVGSLLIIMLMRRWQKAGHRPVILLGGATTMIGDPSGKDQARPVITREHIEHNKASLQKIFHRFLDTSDPDTGAIFVDNYDWWRSISYLDLLGRVGSLITINRMLTFDSVQRRLERQQPLSFLEFNYMILQGYDFVYLAQHYGCRVQFGGSDQWGNMIAGLELAHKHQLADVFVMTSPLLTTASGQKMGKTEQGAVWLNEDRLSHYDYWQYWRNIDDRDAISFLKLFTDLSVQEIDSLLQSSDPERFNEAKILLADQQTILCRGLEAQQAAKAQAESMFSADRSHHKKDLPALFIDPTASLLLIDVMCDYNLVESKSEARRLMRQQGVKIDEQVMTDEFFALDKKKLSDGTLLSLGKKKHWVLWLKPASL